jgi:hypothetical protein
MAGSISRRNEMVFMAYEISPLPDGRTEIRCTPGDIVHIALIKDHNAWTVEEDPERRTYHNPVDVLNRARVIGNDPDFH